jgi:acyl-CoA synthetase (AMP-forming)/AMP-acid ligase II
MVVRLTRKYGIKINSLIFQNYKTNRNVGFTYKYLILVNEEIIKFCKEKQAPYKVPKLVEFRDSIPKSTVGKIMRKVLRAKEEAKAKQKK